MLQNESSSHGSVAVLICVYRNDDPDLFRSAIESILSQDIKSYNIRIYLGIDGDLPEEISAYINDNAGLFYRIHKNSQNIGLAQTLNILIDLLADEEFVFRADADDLNEPARFRLQIAHLESHPGIALIGSQAVDIDVNGAITGTRDFPTDHAHIVKSMCYLNPILHPSYAIRRQVLRDPAARYRPWYLSEDLDFVMRLALRGYRLGNASQRLVRFRTAGAFFARRRSLQRGLVELQLYSTFIYRTRGVFSPAYALALSRFLMRLIPGSWANALYRSQLRHSLLAPGRGAVERD